MRSGSGGNGAFAESASSTNDTWTVCCARLRTIANNGQTPVPSEIRSKERGKLPRQAKSCIPKFLVEGNQVIRRNAH
jgi:hypothetical protein